MLFFCNVNGTWSIMKIFPYSILVLLLLGSAISCLGQEAEEEIVDDEPYSIRIAEISVDITTPQNTFGDRMNENGLGVSAAYLWQTKPDGQIFMGMDFQWAPFYRVSTTFTEVIDGFLENLRESTRTTLWGGHFVTRFHPFSNFPAIDPFVEGLIGAKMIMTNTSVTITETAENIDFIFEKNKLSFSYGASAGFQMHIYDYRYYLFTKATYLRGSSNEFFAIPAALEGRRDLTISELEEVNAPIDILRWQLGLSVTF